MMMMRRIVIRLLIQGREIDIAGFTVTLRANGVALCTQVTAMRFMAIAATHAALVHLALQKRAIDIDFVVDLAIREIQAVPQQSQSMMV